MLLTYGNWRDQAWAMVLGGLLLPRFLVAVPETRVVVSIPPQEYFVRRLASTSIVVASLIPPGANPHSHEPSFEQLRLFERADVFFTIGADGLPYEEIWAEKARTLKTPVRVVPTATRCSNRRAHDPHLWLSPSCVIAMSHVITAELSLLHPEEKDLLEERRKAFQGEIEQFASDLRRRLGTVPGRAFLVYHPAWGHFADEFALNQIAIEHEGKEPDTRQLLESLTLAKEVRVKRLFLEPSAPRANAEMIAREIDGEIVVVDPQAREWFDELRRFSELLFEELR